MQAEAAEIVHKFNSVYGETLTDPQIVLPRSEERRVGKECRL